MGRVGLLVALVGLLVAVATSCTQFDARGLQWRSDDSIEFVVPEERDAVATPFEVSWTDSDQPAGSQYALVINRVPMPPGETLDWFVRDDDTCERNPDCPTLDDLRLRGVIVTDQRSADVTVVPTVIGGRDNGVDELTLVRLDVDGRRISEAAWVLKLEVEASDTL